MSPFEQLRDTICQTLQVPPEAITPTSKAGDIGAWDSLGHVNLMISIEQTFGIELAVEDFQELSSVPAILAFLKSHGIE